MSGQGVRQLAVALTFGATLLAVAVPAQAACYGPRQALPAQAISDFTANPGQLFQQFPGGNGGMSARVRDLLGSDPSALPAVMSLMARATPEQKASLAAGMAQAARICVGRDQAFANEIAKAVADSGDQALILAYQAAGGDTQTAAGPGAAGSPGGVGGPTGNTGNPGGGGGPVEAITGGGVNTGNYSYSSSVGSAGSSANNNNNGSNNATR